MSLSRNDLLTQMATRFADVGEQAVSMADFRWWFEQSLNYQDRDGTFDLTNTMASFTAVVDQNTDWNTLNQSGIRPCAATSAWTAARFGPVGWPLDGTLIVLGTATRVTQLYFPHNRPFAVSRTRLGTSTWSNWRSLNGRQLFPSVAADNTWVRLGTFYGGTVGEACELRVKTNRTFYAGLTDFYIDAVIRLASSNGVAGVPNLGAVYYSLGGGVGTNSKLKEVRVVPVNGSPNDRNWIVYVKVDQFTGNGYYEVSHSPGTDWAHDPAVLVGNPTESVFYTATEQLVVNSPLLLVGLPTYASESAATAAGLAANRLYRTSTGEVRVKL